MTFQPKGAGLFGTVTMADGNQGRAAMTDGGNGHHAATQTATALATDGQIVNELSSQAQAAAGSQAPIGRHDGGSSIIHALSPGMLGQDTGMKVKTHSSVQSSGNSVQALSDLAFIDFKLDLFG